MIKLDLKSKGRYDEEQEQENVVRNISHIILVKNIFFVLFILFLVSSSGSG